MFISVTYLIKQITYIAWQKIQFAGMLMAITENNKLAELWNKYDFISMYVQLGNYLKSIK